MKNKIRCSKVCKERVFIYYIYSHINHKNNLYTVELQSKSCCEWKGCRMKKKNLTSAPYFQNIIQSEAWKIFKFTKDKTKHQESFISYFHWTFLNKSTVLNVFIIIIIAKQFYKPIPWITAHPPFRLVGKGSLQ